VEESPFFLEDEMSVEDRDGLVLGALMLAMVLLAVATGGL
jgi:hypothetical protein